YDSEVRYSAPTCLPDTQVQLFSRIHEWLDRDFRRSAHLLAEGRARSDKSAFAQSIAEKYVKQKPSFF
ncbi:hypothetical protein BV22DRAFT_996238, partial [Leucogyrophana mollusca]